MRAIILAGGSGTRLRPLTCDRPKPMVRVCGRPVIEYGLDQLKKCSVGEATVTLGYLAECISGQYGHSYGGISLKYTVEDSPLGTAGAARLAAQSGSGSAVILSGDAVCDFDLNEIIAEFKRTGADALLAVKKVDDPREYGLVLRSGDGRVSGFIEKPSYLQAISELANTGLYVLSQRALELIPVGVQYDFAKDLFPRMMQMGMSIHAMPQSGYWCDVGDVESYISCQAALLSAKTRCSFSSESSPIGSYTLAGQVYFGKGVKIGRGCVIEGSCVIDDNVTLGDGCSVRSSVLLPGSTLHSGAGVCGAVVDSKATVGAGAMVFEGSVVGQGSQIGPRAVVSEKVRIWPNKKIEAGARLSENLKTGISRRFEFDEHGEVAAAEITPELCVKIGAAAATAIDGCVALADAGTHGARALSDALSAGVRSTGTDVLRIGAAPLPVLGFCLGRTEAQVGIYAGDSGIRLVSASCLGVSRAAERSIEGAIERDEFRRAAPAQFGRERQEAIWQELYGEMLRRKIGSLSGISASVVTQDNATSRFVSGLLSQLGVLPGENIFFIDPKTESFTIQSERRRLPKSRSLMLAAMPDLINGGTVALPCWVPPAAEEFAAAHGGIILRYSDNPADDSDSKARQLAIMQGWQQNPIYAMLRILRFMKQTGSTICELDNRLPRFSEQQREVGIQGNPAWIVGSLGGRRMPDGVQLSLPGGVVMVRPTKRGNAIRILAQAYSSETAAELCDIITSKISTKPKDEENNTKH